MNERREVPLGPQPKLDTIVEDAFDIARESDSGRAVAYIVSNTEAGDEREEIMNAFAKRLRPRMNVRQAGQRRPNLLSRERLQRTIAKLGDRAARDINNL